MRRSSTHIKLNGASAWTSKSESCFPRCCHVCVSGICEKRPRELRYPSPGASIVIRRTLLALLVRLLLAGTFGAVSVAYEEACVFTVLKTSEEGRRSSRLVWDLREANHRWKPPPWVFVGSAFSLADIDLSGDIRGSVILTSA